MNRCTYIYIPAVLFISDETGAGEKMLITVPPKSSEPISIKMTIAMATHLLKHNTVTNLKNRLNLIITSSKSFQHWFSHYYC